MTPEELYYRSVKVAPAHEGAVLIEQGGWLIVVALVLTILVAVWSHKRD